MLDRCTVWLKSLESIYLTVFLERLPSRPLSSPAHEHKNLQMSRHTIENRHRAQRAHKFRKIRTVLDHQRNQGPGNAKTAADNSHNLDLQIRPPWRRAKIDGTINFKLQVRLKINTLKIQAENQTVDTSA